MKYALVLAAVSATTVLAHGVIDSVVGANGVTLPGLSCIDGTPRDCASPLCGSEADTSIIRKNELGTSRASALGRTQGGGPVDAAKMIALFMDGAGGNTSDVKEARELHRAMMVRRRGLLDGLTGALTGGAGGAGGDGAKTSKGTKETGVKAATGAASSDGLRKSPPSHVNIPTPSRESKEHKTNTAIQPRPRTTAPSR